MIAFGLGLSIFIGVSLGLLGGGGSILTLPVLLYLFDLAPKSAIATSLLVVGTTSLVALIPHARAHHVQWQTGLMFGAAGMLGAYVGGLSGAYISSDLLVAAFIAMMVATGLAMWRKPKKLEVSSTGHAPRAVRKIVLDGLVVGIVTGLVGAGGGFLVVPALVLLGGLSMPAAIGTSLMVIAMKSFAGFAGYVSHVEIDLGLACMVTAAAVCGSVVGARFARSVHPDHLRRGFAVFVLTMAAYMSFRELPSLFDHFSFATWSVALICLVTIALIIGIRWLAHGDHPRIARLEISNRQNGIRHNRDLLGEELT